MAKHYLKRLAISALLVGLLGTLPAAAMDPAKAPKPNDPNCKNTGSFERWLDEFRKEARASGVSNATIASALGGMTLDPGIISRDRKQGFFAQTFSAFSGKLISQNRITNGTARLKQHRDLFAKAEKDHGVPGPIIAAFWALESDFGVGMGNLPVLRSLATLAYDCRRPELFRGELMAALKIIDRGDLTPEEMIGSWAGELGQTQFLPTHYLAHAEDYDGDGRRNLLTSVADVIGSTAAFIQHLGWERGQPWLQEVRVPGNLPWDQADLAIQHPRSKWVSLGVTAVQGNLPADNLPASLLLPMGRFGPAFLAYPNFQVYPKWNQSLNYAITAAHLATRLAGAPAMTKPATPIPELSPEQSKELQQLLTRRGFFDGEIDGKIGAATRAGVKKAQMKLGVAADSYPTPELLERLRAAR
ncbi:MAG: lytic murein transglycosylase [Hyphomicrobiaceae bacterium]|jgi:lytic murein transglycosylase